MDINRALKFTLRSLYDTLAQLDEGQYTSHLEILGNQSIGAHIRHILEFFIELEKGYHDTVVDYEARERNALIENSLSTALDKIIAVEQQLDRADKAMTLKVCYANEVENTIQVETNYQRELVYLLEHSIHHMAIIRIGLSAFDTIDVPTWFGVAFSTLKHREQCVR